LTSVALRIVIDVILVALIITALMLASDTVERWLGWSGWGRRLQWLTTSIVVLSVVVVIGAPTSLLLPDRPGTSNVVIDFLVDIGLGALAGVIATGIVLFAAAALGQVIWWAQCQLGLGSRADRWRGPTHSWKRVLREIGRGAALGSVGLVLTAICTALVTTATANPTGAADTPVPRETSVLLTVGLPVLLWFAGTGAVWLLFARRHGDRLKPHRRLLHGTHASALAVCLVVVAAWIAAADLEAHAGHELWSGAAVAVPAVSVTRQQASPLSPYLAQRFEPQLWLASGEHWDPTEVTWYVRQNPRPNTRSSFCKTAGCYEISLSCDSSNPGPCAPSGAGDPALYYRYVTAGTDAKDQLPSAAGAWTLIQYWIFYNYDSLQTWAVNQWHQSDWEQVSVLVRRRGNIVRPVEVAFSEHCYGARVPAERVRWSAGSHPVVYVGRGSHANYPRPISVPVRQLRCSLGLTPRYLGIAGLFFSPAVDGSRLEIPLAYLAGLRDHANGARPVPPPKLVALDTARAINSFRGYWGLDNNLSPFGILRLRASAGPPAPQTQGSWITPFRSMLCNGRWLRAPAVRRSEIAWVCQSG
jgi:hypothetical protein